MAVPVTALLMVVSVVAVAVVAFVRSERRRADLNLKVAHQREAAASYEEACLHYAVAAGAGADRTMCETKIRALWDAYGPFEFSDWAEQQTNDYCRCGSCGEGYHQLMIAEIRRIVSTRSPEA